MVRRLRAGSPATRRGPCSFQSAGAIGGLVEHLEEQALGGTAGIAARQQAPNSLEELEAAVRIGHMEAAEPVAGMQIDAHAEAEPDQGIDGGVELGELARHVVRLLNAVEQRSAADRQPDMA